MKNKIKLCLATTGLSLILITIVATLYHGHFLCLSTVYEAFLANIVIHLGLTLLEHFESPYFLIEILIEVGYMLLVLILFGMFFNWYSSIPLWVLILIGIITYIIGCCIDIFQITNNLSFINKHLQPPTVHHLSTLEKIQNKPHKHS